MSVPLSSVDQIIKVNGVLPLNMVKLHEVLDGPKVRSVFQNDHISHRTDIIYAKLLSAKWNENHETYTVEIQLCMKQHLNLDLQDASGNQIKNKRNSALYAPFSVLRAIYGALGFYPDTEEFAKPSH